MPVRHTPMDSLWPEWWGVVYCAVACTAVTPGVSAQNLDQARQRFVQGHYDEVIRTAQSRLAAHRYSDTWRILLMESLLMVGRYPEAYTNSLDAMNSRSSSLELRLLAREAALYQNDIARANRLLSEAQLLIQRRSFLYQSEEHLVPLGRALLLLGVEPKLVLENCFRAAERLEPPPRDAFLAIGDLALEKHDFALAANTFRAGLQRFPNDPDMNYGLAKSFETGDRSEMLAALKAALAANPRHVRSLLLMADHSIDAEQYGPAEKYLGEVLKVNPHQPQALTYRAVLAHLRNDGAGEQALRTAALRFWNTNPEVDYLLGRKLAQKYRFEEAAAAQRRALGFDPGYLPARRELAEDLLRLGRSDEGWRLAQEVHQLDNYDVTAFNLVTLKDAMARFRTLTNAHFVVRMSSFEAGLYGDRVLELLERARKTLCAKYGLELVEVTTVEIFPEQKDFAVRTFGMPDNPGYLGVCFGPVITANSPASQGSSPPNWHAVLWHEFAHVITLTATRNRMPRWLSEGISVYEERQANPAWGQSMNLAWRRRILEGRITPLGELSGAFLTPKDSRDLQFAYFESSLAVEFLVQRFGFDVLKSLLSDLRRGESLNDCLPARTRPLPELEKEFAAFAREQAVQLAPDADLDEPSPKSLVPDAIWTRAHPNNYFVKMEQARQLMENRQWNEAKPLLESLARSYAGERGEDNPLWLLAVVERNLERPDAEWVELEKMAQRDADFVELYARLIELAEARQDWPAATRYAEALLAINPLLSAPYRVLGRAGTAGGDAAQAIFAYRKLLLLDPPDPADVHFQLARLLHAEGGMDAEARRHVLQALEEAPRYRDAQRLLLELTATPPATVLRTNPPATAPVLP